MNRKRPQWLHFNTMIPNILTIMALSAGMSGIKFGLEDRWEFAALSILATSSQTRYASVGWSSRPPKAFGARVRKRPASSIAS